MPVIKATSALVAVKRGSAGARGTEDDIRSNEAGISPVVDAVELISTAGAVDGGTVTEVAGGGVVEMVGLRMEIPSVPNTLFVVLRLFA
ncbi:hypothetical protein M378DRAFT_15129 [Amanita muscaria Koide BX008]|uniref:Uncharacterized protein n=1 Tax=Amanita muscaria (strain Koide BX008) TaxID=946122 RepID=A0A0C2SY40_AMAMK|nr:hypothetical protein M378DRAFT_15129 [Amanita muscaria Koide BX008]